MLIPERNVILREKRHDLADMLQACLAALHALVRAPLSVGHFLRHDVHRALDPIQPGLPSFVCFGHGFILARHDAATTPRSPPRSASSALPATRSADDSAS